MAESHLKKLDFVAIACYFGAVIGTGLFAMCKNKRDTVKGYFLAGRFMTWLPVGASLFASNIGSEHFIGLAGSGAASGIAVGAFELNACFFLQLLGWVFLPVYIASGVCTLPEYMKKRFGGQRIRVYLAALSLLLYIFTKISVNLYSGALFIQQALDWNLYVSVLLLLSITALTTVTGGLAAVIYTDTLQTCVMISGAFILTILGFVKVGGYKNLYHGFLQAAVSLNHTIMSNHSLPFHNVTTPYEVYDYSDATNMAKCGQPRPDSWYMLRDPLDKHMPWPGFLLGQTTASIWYWCTDQIIVQRTLATKSLSHAQGSTLFAGFLKILPVFILVIPGMISRVLFTDAVACNDPVKCMEVCQNPRGCSNIAFPKMVLEIMPSGLKGLMMSVMLAALIGELTSIFNSASTLFTMDVYRTFKKDTRTRELMIVGRLFVCVMVVISILWIPIVQSMQGAQLYIYIQSVSAYLAPPIAAVYLSAILWTRTNEKGAFSGLMVGLVLGSVRMVCNFIYDEPGCGEIDYRPVIISKIHYMYFAFILFIFTLSIVVVVSLITEAPLPRQVFRTTYWTRYAEVTDDNYDDVIGRQSIKSEVDLNGVNTSPDEAKPLAYIDFKDPGNEAKKTSKLNRLLVWFCGLSEETEENGEVKAAGDGFGDIERTKNHFLDGNKMLEQTAREQFLLRVFLVVLISLALFMYTFFSTGSDFGLLRKHSEA